MRLRMVATAALLVLTRAVPAAAQDSDGGPDRSQTISFSPILALFEILQADYELRVHPEATAGLGVGYWNFGDAEANEDVGFLALDLKGRFYPDRAFEGFAFGGSIGVTQIEYFDDSTEADEEQTGFTFGIEVSRAWLLGDENRFFLAAGLGAKRYWFDDVDDDVPVVLPTGRLGVGIAF